MSRLIRFSPYLITIVFYLISECKVNIFCIYLQVFSQFFLLKIMEDIHL